MSVERLVAQLNAESDEERAWAAEDLGCGDVGTALPALLARVRVEPSRAVREAIVTALSRLTDPAVPAGVAELLSHDDAFLRNGAVALLRARGAAAVPAIRRAFESPDPDLRKLALDILGAIETPDADALYEAGLRDRDINVRIAAIEYVGEHRRAGFRPCLEALFPDEPNPMLLAALFATLASIGTEQTWSVIAARFPTVESVPAFLRGAWLRALAQWRTGDTLETLAANAPHASPEDLVDAPGLCRERLASVAAPSPLLAHLEALLGASIAPTTKYRILEWLGGLHEAEPISAMVRAQLSSTEPLVAQGAREALARLKPEGWQASVDEQAARAPRPSPHAAFTKERSSKKASSDGV